MPWDPPLDSQVLAIHAALLGTGQVLYFGGDEHSRVQHDANNVDHTRIYDPGTNAVSTPPAPSSPTADVFCCGHAQLPDGRLLVAGGTEDFPLPPEEFHHGHFPGLRDTWIFHPRTQRWRRAADMNFEPGHAADRRGGGRWYPTLVTLANGEVLALGGHPSATDRRPTHNNDTPERYLAGADRWTLLSATTVDCPNYPRTHVLADGRVFISSPIAGTLRRYDPVVGAFVGAGIPRAGDGLYDDFRTTSVLLPLVPGDGYRPRVLVVGAEQPRRIDLGAASPVWQDAGTRQGAAAGRRRQHLCAVLLPTGQVFVSGGITPSLDAAGRPVSLDVNAVLHGEIYTPGIDWSTGSYSAAESWATADPATVPRNYHSTALLLPNGRVWTAGSSINAAEGLPSVVGQRRIEVYRPPYDGQPGRPSISAAPRAVGYGQRFEVRTPQAADIRRVALIRAGSVTHAFDPDQRYVLLQFTRPGGDRLSVIAPPHGAVAPPGVYMLWILDSSGRPCQEAPMVRIGALRSFVVTDRSTFSIHEVRAQLPPGAPGPANFPRSLYVVCDGFLPSEVPSAPNVAFTFDSPAGTVVPGMTASFRALLLEDPSALPDQPQRLTFVFDVRFANAGAFAGFTERRSVNVRARSGPHIADGGLSLTQQPNPYMIDGPVSWLSTDVRVFQIRAGGAQGGVVHGSGAGAPQTFITQLLGAFNAAPNDEYHPFLDLSQDPQASRLELSRSVGGQRVYNYAVAKVRYRAASVPAANVKVFFRGFTTVGTALEYDTGGAYRRVGTGAAAIPLLGVRGGALTSIPFFAAARVDTSTSSMAVQTDPPNRRTLNPAGAAEFAGYFGAWLDFNQTEPRFPPNPGGDGPYTGRQSIQQLIRGRHLCLVAEVFFEPDLIPAGATPASSENLSQRNLAIVESDNPGDPSSHRVQHTFEVRPSQLALGPLGLRHEGRPAFLDLEAGEPPPDAAGPGEPLTHDHGHGHDHADEGGDVGVHGVATLGVATHVAAPLDPTDAGPDELLFQWQDLPADTRAVLYMPDVDVDAVIEAAAARQGPPVLEKLDDHTIGCRIGDVSYVPLPHGRQTMIPGLLTLDLPPTVKRGERFTVTVHQISGVTRAIIGAFELAVVVTSAPLMLAEEVRTLAVLRHITAGLSPGDRWEPVLRRYVEQSEARVRALGGSPDAVEPSPDGGPKDQPRAPSDRLPGPLRELIERSRRCWRRLGRCCRVLTALLTLSWLLMVWRRLWRRCRGR